MSLKPKNQMGYRCSIIKSEAYKDYIISPTPALKLTHIIHLFLLNLIFYTADYIDLSLKSNSSAITLSNSSFALTTLTSSASCCPVNTVKISEGM